ncbi:MAG: Sporulation associated-membrane protein [Candidatus Wolfebacteria bacterium GW2011_GWC1_43_10]|uniref:Sporulation associated-membrane protein n=2 Tax=Candidatus Wolfeibacteriota TaxID=1752735 RepID=A0A0G1F6P4_9BACT|nr:MAG: Sporulation associated-membrane protein [Candidatus Wolfebacteria bacterium GW2011_GWC1_43_10]KKT23133.1 MAG: Sporulation associated-membrane protein [Parcubacteria group bacterium GW2011_GWB1_43_8b]OGM89251.1 MAG: hypothetical protein A2108_00025 [Candidatus Wolfebacteria bacterium GWA1_42_9]
MSYLFNEFLYRPLLNLLFLIYNNIWADLGVAIILLTIIIRLILLPLFYKSAKDQTIIQKITPRIKEIQKNHKDNKEKQVREIMAVYKEHKVNPLSGFLLMLIQLPILIALYRVFWKGLSSDIFKLLYPFVGVPENISHSFLGLVDLNQKSLAIVIIAALAQYFQSKLLMSVGKKNSKSVGNEGAAAVAEKISRQMVFLGPVLTFVILYSLPSAVGIYWLTTSVFSVIQQIVINKRLGKRNERDTGNSPQVN